MPSARLTRNQNRKKVIRRIFRPCALMMLSARSMALFRYCRGRLPRLLCSRICLLHLSPVVFPCRSPRSDNAYVERCTAQLMGVVVLIRRGRIVFAVRFNKLPALDFSPILEAAASNRGITYSRMSTPGVNPWTWKFCPRFGGMACIVGRWGSATIPAPSPKPTVL
jgi:hypothetical protein